MFCSYKQMYDNLTIWSKIKVNFETQGTMKFITLSPTVMPLLHSGTTAQGLQVIARFRRPLGFEV